MDVKTLCLGALQLGDATGYEIKKMFEDGLFSHLHQASFGSIYPALARLEHEGLAISIPVAQEGRPDKKVYRLTAKGHEALVEALQSPPMPDRQRSDFLFILAFGHLLPPTRLRTIIEARIAWYRACIGRMESCDLSRHPPSVRLVNGLGLAVYRAAVEYLEMNLDAAVADEQPAQPFVAE